MVGGAPLVQNSGMEPPSPLTPVRARERRDTDHVSPLAGLDSEMGVTVIAPGRSRLYEEAGALTFSLFANLESVRPLVERHVELTGDGAGPLLASWIHHWMALSHRERILFARFRVETIGEHQVTGSAWGEEIDSERHRLHRDPGSMRLRKAHLIEAKDACRAFLVFGKSERDH